MIIKKICVVGAFAVGKSSLIRQFVHSIFSDKYLSTIGVKINKKILKIGERDMTMMIWDMEGQDSVTMINANYLRGAAGFFVVVDCSRKETLSEGLDIRANVLELLGDVPSCLLINKSDLTESNELLESDYNFLDENNIKYVKTSAKTGEGVEHAFLKLAEDLIK